MILKILASKITIVCFVALIFSTNAINSKEIDIDTDDNLPIMEGIKGTISCDKSCLESISEYKNSLVEIEVLQQCNNSLNLNQNLDEDVEMFSDDGNSTISGDGGIDDESFTNIQWTPPPGLVCPGISGNFSLSPPNTLSKDWCKTKTSEVVFDNNKNTTGENESIKDICLHKNGTLTWTDNSKILHTFLIKDFCVDSNSISGNEVRFQVCNPPPTEYRTEVPKCCQKNEVVDSSTNNCIPSRPEWSPIFYREPNQKEMDGMKRNFTLTFGFPNRFPNCSKPYFVQSNVDLKYPNLLLNGTLILVDGSKNTPIPNGQFCIDGIYDNSHPQPSNGTVVSYSGSEWDQIVIICSPNKSEIPPWIPPIYAFVNHTAAFFLFLTALVYILLWSHQNIHGWLQFSYTVSLFFAFSFLAVVQFWTQEIHRASSRVCACLGWLIHFTFLSAFFWLTSMNFDLWWRFSGRRSLRRIRSKPSRENVIRFIYFALFSLGFPVLISGTAVVLDHIYTDMNDFWIKLPRFGHQKCYFEDKKSQFPFLYGPFGVLLLIDLIFFASTVLHLRKIHSNTELARAHSTLEDKKGVRLIAKLFIVMGVLWIFEFISWAANIAFPDSERLLIWVFMPTDILNSLQGIAIFVIFICKPNVMEQLRAKYQGAVEGKAKSSTTTTTTNNSSNDWCVKNPSKY